MNLPTITCTCEVCGGEGQVSLKNASNLYTNGSFFSHKDSRICTDNLKNKKKKEINEIDDKKIS